MSQQLSRKISLDRWSERNNRIANCSSTFSRPNATANPDCGDLFSRASECSDKSFRRLRYGLRRIDQMSCNRFQNHQSDRRFKSESDRFHPTATKAWRRTLSSTAPGVDKRPIKSRAPQPRGQSLNHLYAALTPSRPGSSQNKLRRRKSVTPLSAIAVTIAGVVRDHEWNNWYQVTDESRHW